jgi:hypothetical protein
MVKQKTLDLRAKAAKTPSSPKRSLNFLGELGDLATLARSCCNERDGRSNG